MNQRLIFSLLLACTLGSLLSASSPHTVDEDGQTGSISTWQAAPIYYSATAGKVERDAAADLSSILERITGENWPVEVEPEAVSSRAVLVGRTLAAVASKALVAAPESIPPQESLARLEQSQRFRVKLDRQRIILTGATPEATRQAVYWFLQNKVGVRWFIPEELGEELPASTSIRLAASNELIEPSFLNRHLGAAWSHPGRKNWDERNLLTPTWPMGHALDKIVTPDLFETKPHWFSLIKGKLSPTKGGRGPNPNLAEPEVAAFVAEQALRAFEEKPDGSFFSISTTDNINFDESPATMAIVSPFRYFRSRPDYSDLVFGFANQVARDIWPLQADGQIDFNKVPEAALDKYLTSLAYYWAENVPSFPVHPRVIPYLTSDRAQWFSQSYREEDKALIKAWVDAGPEIVGTWDYYEGGPYFIPRCFTGIVAESIPFLHRAGVRAFFAEGRAHWGFDAPRVWLATQLLVDAEQDSDVLLDEFYQRYFQEAEVPMRAFYELCEKQWMSQPGTEVWLKYYWMPSQAELFPLDVWDELGSYLEEAEALAESDRVRERLALVRTDYEFGRAACAVYFTWQSAFQGHGSEEDYIVARRAFEEAELPDAYRNESVRLAHLDATDLSLLEHPDDAELRLFETFEQPLYQGDALPTGPMEFRSKQMRGAWQPAAFNNDTFNFQRRSDSAASGKHGVRFEGVTLARINRLMSATADTVGEFSAQFRGMISPGSRIELAIVWLDASGKMIGDKAIVQVPSGDYQDWRALREQATAPPDTEWVYLTLSIQQQGPDDYLDVDDIRFWEWAAPKDVEP